MEQNYVDTLVTLAKYKGQSKASIDRIIKDGEDAAKKKYFELLDKLAEYLTLPQETIDKILKEPDPKKEKKYLETQDEVAKYLGLTQVTVNKLVKDGKLKGERTSDGEIKIRQRFSADYLNRYLLTRIKKKSGKDFEKTLSEIAVVESYFGSLNTYLVTNAMIRGKEFDEALKESRIDSRGFSPDDFTPAKMESACPPRELRLYEKIRSLYENLDKDARRYVENELILSPISASGRIAGPQGSLSEHDIKMNEIYLRYNKIHCLMIMDL